jgi:transmembrane sensor
MTEKFYDILSRHFANEATEFEEIEVSDYKAENPKEYNILKRVWDSNKIEIKDFDSNQAWNIIYDKIEKNRTKVISLYRNLKRIAIAASVLILATIGTYLITKTNSKEINLITEINTDDSPKMLTLSDGSEIWLNTNASLTYPRKFPKGSRDVKLDGEAYFDVAKNFKSPFIIKTNHSDVKVVGTSFNISTNEESTKVTVNTGAVQVSSNKLGQKLILEPDQQAIITNNQIFKSHNKNPNYLSWKTGYFIFKNTDLRYVVRDLNTFYKEEIILDQNFEKECLLTAKFDKLDIDVVLEVIKVTCNVEIIDNKNNYLIR